MLYALKHIYVPSYYYSIAVQSSVVEASGAIIRIIHSTVQSAFRLSPPLGNQYNIIILLYNLSLSPSRQPTNASAKRDLQALKDKHAKAREAEKKMYGKMFG